MPPDPILTVDVEEWFHVCGHPEYADPGLWDRLESRVGKGVEAILALLDGSGSRATFFVLGWVARKLPGLVRSIAAAGHDVACHGDLHRRLFEIPDEEFREDVRKARGTLEDLLGLPVMSYRAPEWSMRTAGNPKLAILVEEGFRIDSSLVAAPPVGSLENPVRPAYIGTPAGAILEVPPLTGTFFFRRAILGGGVCSRMSRLSRVIAAIEAERAAGAPPVLYLHPWELDRDHPEMRLSFVGSLVHFAGRGRTAPRIAALLKRYTFQPITSVLGAGEAAA